MSVVSLLNRGSNGVYDVNQKGFGIQRKSSDDAVGQDSFGT